MQKVTIEAVFRADEEGKYGMYHKVAIKIKEATIGEVEIGDRWISKIFDPKKNVPEIEFTGNWKEGDEVFINFVVTDKGYFNFNLPDEKDRKIAELEAKVADSGDAGETPAPEGDADVDPDKIDF